MLQWIKQLLRRKPRKFKGSLFYIDQDYIERPKHKAFGDHLEKTKCTCGDPDHSGVI